MKEITERVERQITREARQDAIKLCKHHLEGFRGQKEYVSNLVEQQAEMCLDVQQLTPQYGEHIGHSTTIKIHPGEILAEDAAYQELKHKITTARKTLERIERTTSLLAPAEKTIIEMRYFGSRPETWNNIAWKVGYTERQCRRLHVKALRFSAVSMFGLDAVFKNDI